MYQFIRLLTKAATAAFLSLFPLFSPAADVHVDALSTAADPDGSRAAPYPSLKAGVGAANLLADASVTVYVRGGEGRLYAFADSDDSLVLEKPGLRLVGCGADWTPAARHAETDRMARVAVADDYAARSHDKAGSTSWAPPIAVTATNAVVSGLSCAFGPQSFGQNGKGNWGLVRVAADDVTVRACRFRMTTDDGVYGGAKNPVACGSVAGRCPERVLVEECAFRMGKYRADVSCIYGPGNGSAVRESLFEGVDTLLEGPKASGVFLAIVSNVFLNCANEGDGWQGYLIRRGGDAYPAGGEIAYNRFVRNDGSTRRHALLAHGDGWNGCWNKDPIRIHHNTVVGYDILFAAPLYGASGHSWKPEIFDNLIFAPDGTLFVEEATALWPGQTSSFRPGSTFSRNAVVCSAFVSGSATELAGYDLQGSLTGVETTISPPLAPYFLNTDDPASPDFYRLNAAYDPWVLDGSGGPAGDLPSYVGALAPAIGGASGEHFAVRTFTAEADSLFAPATVTFRVAYVENAGDVTVSWDFDGDGVFEGASAATEAVHAYSRAGTYRPAVRIENAATGRVAVGRLTPETLDVVLVEAFVDAVAPAGGDGTAARPFRSIAEGARAVGAGGRVRVRGGADRTYAIASAADLVSVTRPGVTVAAEAETGPATVVVDRDLAAATNNPTVFRIAAGADGVVVSGLDVLYFCNDRQTQDGNSLGRSGRLFCIEGRQAVIERCAVRMEGVGNWNWGGRVIDCPSPGEGRTTGDGLTVRDCVFRDLKNRFWTDGIYLPVVYAGRDPLVCGNVFSNCQTVVFMPKQVDCGASIVSNRIVNCTPILSRTSGYGEFRRAEIAYNTFVTDVGTPFIVKGRWGLTERETLIHHNTVVGSRAFVEVTDVRSLWRPRIFDNLIVLGPGGTNIVENGSSLPEGNASSFAAGDGAVFRNNAFFADAMSGGTAAAIDGHDLAAGLEIADNVALESAPSFVSDDLFSPDFCRPSAPVGRPLTKLEGKAYPAHVGAQPPRGQKAFILLLR